MKCFSARRVVLTSCSGGIGAGQQLVAVSFVGGGHYADAGAGVIDRCWTDGERAVVRRSNRWRIVSRLAGWFPRFVGPRLSV